MRELERCRTERSGCGVDGIIAPIFNQRSADSSDLADLARALFRRVRIQPDIAKIHGLKAVCQQKVLLYGKSFEHLQREIDPICFEIRPFGVLDE